MYIFIIHVLAESLVYCIFLSFYCVIFVNFDLINYYSDPGFETGPSDDGGQLVNLTLVVFIWMIIAVIMFLFR